ncbi:hypothetical protein PIB30_114742, partial [Stylosanthes scabra]|nr:hypothetical protein [Stylosanthes scabra]
MASIKQVQLGSKEFNSKVFGNIFVRKRKLEEKIRHIQLLMEDSDAENLRKTNQELQDEFNK